MPELKRCSLAAMLLTAFSAVNVFAQGDAPSSFSPQALVEPVALAVVFTIIGMILFGICLLLIVKLTPFSVRKEIEEDQNTALGIIIGSMILGIAIILAAALHG